MSVASLVVLLGCIGHVAAQTCGAVKKAYKESGCCGQPEKKITGLPECAICVVGCAPYTKPEENFPIWSKTVEHMADTCEVMIHVGDTKSGSTPCNESEMAEPIVVMKNAAKAKGKMLLYTMGDNEVTDCHRGWYREGRDPAWPGGPYNPSQFYNSEAARNLLINKFGITQPKDITGAFTVDTQSTQCPFHKYVEKCGFAVVTLEVAGSHWGLAGGGSSYPKMNEVDPVSERIAGYTRAKDCALSWLDQSLVKMKGAGLKSMIVAFHANMFGVETSSGYYNWGMALESGSLIDNGSVSMTGPGGGQSAFLPLANKLFDMADANPDIMFRIVHADSHYWRIQKPWKDGSYRGARPNLEDVMVEGSTPEGFFGLTTYGKITMGNSDDPVDKAVVKNVNVKDAHAAR